MLVFISCLFYGGSKAQVTVYCRNIQRAIECSGLLGIYFYVRYILHCTPRCTFLLGTLCSSYIEILTNNVHSVRRALTKLPIRKLPAFARTCLFPVQTGFWFSQKFFSMYAFVFILLHSTKCMSCSSILLMLPACPAFQVC